MSSDESDTSEPGSLLVPPGVLHAKRDQLDPTIRIKKENGTPNFKLICAPSTGAGVRMPLVTDRELLSLGSAVKTAAAKLLQPVMGASSTLLEAGDPHANSGQDSQDEDDQETAGISGGGSPYGGAGKSSGPVSPSPYTANTLRAKAFNAYVKGLIEQRLNLHIPISLQPRDLLAEIIADVQCKFPDFSACVRKRIRTFLKSYRRSKKVRESIAVANAAVYTTPTSTRSLTNGTNSLDSSPKLPATTSGGSSQLLDPAQNLQTAIVTIALDNQSSPSLTPPADTMETTPPDRKRPRLESPPPAMTNSHPLPRSETNSPQLSQGLCSSEVNAVRQLVMGYRESAAFLMRAADKLEQILPAGSL